MAIMGLTAAYKTSLSLHLSPSSKISLPCKNKPGVTCFSPRTLLNNSRGNCSVEHTDCVADRVLMDIQESAIIACLRAQNAEVAFEAARAALRAGIVVLEVVMSTPGVFEVLRALVQEYPSTSIGVGTVLDRRDAHDAIRYGAKFIMSPAMVKEILEDVSEGQALYIPGVMTPTEILFASKGGAKIVKIYPVSALGGIQYMSAIRKPFPHIPMVASQGITLDSVGQYLSQGVSASGVVLSDAIFDKQAMADQNFDRINQLALSAVSRATEALQSRRRDYSPTSLGGATDVY